jgi:hypothetical protein
LWKLKAYRSSVENWLAGKKRAEQDRKDYELFKYNVEQAKRTIMQFSQLEEKFALPLAVDKVKNNKEHHIIAMGGQPFIRDFDKLP